MGDCRLFGQNKQLRDLKGNTPNSTATLNKIMDRWRKKQELLKK